MSWRGSSARIAKNSRRVCGTAILLIACVSSGMAQGPTGTKPMPEVDSAAQPDGRSVPVLSADEQQSCPQLGFDAALIAALAAKPLYEFNEAEVHVYLQWLADTQPDLRQRIAHLARKNIGQPYELYLLGEMPFEHHDPQPLYCLSKSDCLVFAEHTYAMALSTSWPSFMRLLQRIRYSDGRIGVATRNHYTEADWNPANSWLVRDITAELAGDQGVSFRQQIDRARFLKKRYGLTVDIPVEEHVDVYLPFADVATAEPHLLPGDFVNIVRGMPASENAASPANETFGGSAWVGHVGLIVRGEDDRVHLIHSARPAVREEALSDYIDAATRDVAARDAAGKPRLLGFKFLRLEDQPLRNLRARDGPDAPQIHLP